MTAHTAELLSPQELASKLDQPGLRLVDASWYHPSRAIDARVQHAQAHLPGAVHFDIDRIAAPFDGRPHMLPDAETFAAGAGALGIGEGDFVVVYDQEGLASAACRVWWTFRHFGQARVAVLDGGLPAWRRAGLPLSSGDVEVSPVPRGNLPGRLPLLDRAQVHALLDRPDRLLLDARSPERHAGSGLEPWGEAGRIPGSRNLPYTELLDAQGALLPPDRLAAILGATDLEQAPLATYCGSGVTACVLIFALARLGREDVALYDGSWAEWVRSPGTPRARG